MYLPGIGLMLLMLYFGQPVEAGVGSKVVQEAVEFATRKFGKEVAEEGLEQLSKRMTKLAARHGDDVVAMAYRKVGPRAGRLVSEVGEQQADTMLRFLARHGDDAIPLATRGSAMKLVGRYGDDAADALVRHGAVGEQLIGTLGETGAKALAKVSPQNGRRLAMLAGDGALKPELMDVICRHGDRACEFIWQNKGALAVGATLTTFLAAPGDFLSGTAQLTQVVGQHVITPVATEVLAPIAAMPQAVAVEVAKGTNWTVIGIVVLLLIAFLVAVTLKSSGWVGPLMKRAAQRIRDHWTSHRH